MSNAGVWNGQTKVRPVHISISKRYVTLTSLRAIEVSWPCRWLLDGARKIRQ